MSTTTTLHPRALTARWTAGAYALLVIGTAVFTAAANAATDESMAGVWLMLVTLPFSFVAMLTPLTGTALLAVLTAIGLAQAGALWFLITPRTRG